MKKISIAIISLFAFSFLSATALATSGACSDHGGVDCSAGSQANGNVVCNDGWTGSSVSYSSMDKCQASAPVCTHPTQPSCSLSEIQQEEKSAVGTATAEAAAAGELGSTFGSSAIANVENTYSLEYSQCQSQWTSYQSALSDYNSCIQNQDAALSQQAQSETAQDESELNAICAQSNGAGSTWIWNGSFPTGNFDSIISAQCTSSTDQLFQKYFKIAMNILPPQYQSVVDPNVIEPLTLDPANANKTFSQIIVAAYPNVMTQTSTPATSSSSASVDSTPSTPVNTTTTTPSLTIAINQNLSVGASGNDVISLQSFLMNKGFLTLPAGTAQGYFGNLTKTALVSFQASVSLPATGYCGPMTRAAINGS
jgi:murein L,D-transpeptidase YcbB/YkuD